MFENFRQTETFKQDFEAGREAQRTSGRPKCPFSHSEARTRRFAWYAGLNYEKGIKDYQKDFRRIFCSKSFSEDRERGFADAFLQ